MKKTIITILIFLSIFIKNTNALTQYGEYYKVDDITNLKEDEMKIESYKVYNTYKLEYIDLGYMLNNDDYIIDENDFIYEENLVSDYKDDDVFIKIPTYYNKVRYLAIGKFSENFKIYEFEFYDKNGEKIEYTNYNLDGFISENQENIININDGNYDTYYENDLKESPQLNVDLQEYYALSDLTIKIHSEQGIDSNFIIYLDVKNKINLFNNIKRLHTINFINGGQLNRIEYLYLEKTKLYKHYKENKIVLNEYIKEGNNIILEDYKIINELYKRDKLIIKDDLIITNTNILLEDFIEYKTNDVIIKSNINYNKNGIYTVKFILNDIIIEKDILVDIPSNNKIELDNTISTTDKESDKNIYINNETNNINNKEMLNNNDNLENKINEENEDIKQVIEEDKKENEIKKVITKENETKKEEYKKNNTVTTKKQIIKEAKSQKSKTTIKQTKPLTSKTIKIKTTQKITQKKESNIKNNKLKKISLIITLMINLVFIKKEKEILSKVFKKLKK